MLRSLYSWGGAMAHVSLSFHRCECCGAYHLMTSACFGEWIIIEAEDEVYAYGEWIIIEDEDEEVYEVYAFFECIECMMLPMPTRPPPM